MRISDWSSDVCSSDLDDVLTVSIHGAPAFAYPYFTGFRTESGRGKGAGYNVNIPLPESITPEQYRNALRVALARIERHDPAHLVVARSEEHTSELQSLMRNSYAVFCFKKKTHIIHLT